jgi:hypothetical protein
MERAIEKAFVSFRVGVSQWMTDEGFEGLLALLDRHPGATDEISFFTSETHPPLPLEELGRRCRLLERRMKSARERGYRAGINILATIGHHEENLANSLSGDFVHVTDIEGKICRGALCPNSEATREYVRSAYRFIAEAGPDFIWIDDDVRLIGHLPLRFGCFCDECLELFARSHGQGRSRSELREGFDQTDVARKLALRKAWLGFNRETISRLMSLIEETVHGSRPGLPLGFMTGERYFEGYDFDGVARVLAGPAGSEVRWRPGGGFYSDENLGELTTKSHEIGRQVSLLPPTVRTIQSEIENFPYQRLKKAARTTSLEAASHIAAGCTGAAFNVLSMYDEPLDEYVPLVAELAGARRFLDSLVRAFARREPAGVFCAWGKDSFAAHNLRKGSWLGAGDAPIAPAFGEELLSIGLPPAYAPANARLTALAGDSVMALEDSALRAILRGGVLMDARAAIGLHERGMGDLVGFSVDGFREADCIEELVVHPLNGLFAGRRRDGRQSFWKNPAALLGPRAPGAQPLSRLVDYAGKEAAGCTMGVFENALGGRVCVAGYCPWTFLQNLSKSSQMKSVVRWLSRDALDLYVESFHRINVWARPGADGEARFALVNAGLDEATGLSVLVRADATHVRIVGRKIAESLVPASGTDGPYRRFTLPPMPAWTMVLGIAENRAGA